MVGKKKWKEIISIFITFFISALIHFIIFFLIFGQATQRELIIELSTQKKAASFKERYKKNRSLKVSMSKLNGEIDRFLNIKIKDTNLRVAMLKLKKNSVTYGNTLK